MIASQICTGRHWVMYVFCLVSECFEFTKWLLIALGCLIAGADQTRVAGLSHAMRFGDVFFKPHAQMDFFCIRIYGEIQQMSVREK